MWLCVSLWNKGFVKLQTTGNRKIGNRRQTVDEDNRVVTGVVNFAHINIYFSYFFLHQ